MQRALTAPLLLCDRVVANSRHTADHVLHRWPRLADRVVVVHNGFAFDDPAPVGRPPAPDGEVLVVGRLSPRKGQDVAIRAVRRLHDAGWPVRLRVVGTPFPGYEWFEADLRRDALDLGIADHVTFDGYRDDIPACNAAADIVLVPSRVEPFGNVAVEALAAARPLVASDVGGLREFVQHDRTGVLVPPDDDEALAAAVAGLLAEPERAASMASAGARSVRARFSMAAYAEGVERLLRTAASEGRRPRQTRS
jgi:glycosyltransferase involved in cell wall biosynthesis